MRTIRRSKNPIRAQAEERLAQKAERQLAGMYAPEAPGEGASRMPRDLTEIGDSELMELFAEMTAWVNFHGTLLSKAQVEEKYAESVLEIRRAAVVLGNKTKSVAESKALAMGDKEVQEANNAYLDAYAARKKEEAAYNNADRLERLISRELTRRTGRGDRDNRNNKWSA